MYKEITIIICSYNGEQRLPEVLDKIMEQEKVEDFVCEIIVVDNNSTDKTKNVIFQYVEGNFPIPVRYIYEKNSGLSNARKKGVESCKTKWIAFLDDDNLVDKKWIINIEEYIHKNPDIGAFNGAVIPYIPFEISTMEEQRLKASLKVLACTHYNIEELCRHPVSPFRNPIGAGMVILSQPLKELSLKGWLNSGGRTKDNLTSGEDGEMAFYVKKQGYKFGFCSKAILYHKINKSRLSDDYLNKMWFEIGCGVAIVAKNERINKLFLLGYRILLEIRRILYSVENPYRGKYYRKYIEGFKNEI